ncbi:MAG: SDR family NAD(P)-dependent oxidoreductase [Proteobacteria bacterium]|nr:SDR family NAD(P)-dependent oxidoreductase [Pseudomonadota bacterium]MDA0868378.1 SDR family NAD(P)-dependent oxidoreductase [Pseudomonadota bacterium]MDA1328570.1 SDR family NAD(P)-dependent oxidoreductase [Pseudomonadota bacterium]
MNTLDLNGRTAIITGAAQGIGLAIAQRFVASGAKVALWDMNLSGAQAAAKQLGAAAAAFGVELTNEASIRAGFDATLASFGQVDVLVNNAGITGGNAATWELDTEVWRQVVDVNLVAPFMVCKVVVPHLIAQGGGRIVNIASIAGKEGNPNASHYSASKAGLIALTKSLGKELASHGVLVNAITPAAAKTPIFDSMTPQHIDYMLSKIPMGRFVEVEEVAAMAGWLASPDCSFSTGAVFDISGGRATY